MVKDYCWRNLIHLLLHDHLFHYCLRGNVAIRYQSELVVEDSCPMRLLEGM